MKQNLRFIFMTLLCAVFSTAWGEETSTMVLEQALGKEQNGSIIAADQDGKVIWTVTSDADESNFDNERGVHFGTGKKAVSYLQFTTSAISGTITKIVVNASGASSTSAKLDVTIGNKAFGSQQSLTSSAANYTFEGSASGEIVVRLSQTSATKALYLKSIEVTYISGTTPTGPTDPTVTFATDPLTVKKGSTATNTISKPNDLTVSYSSGNTAVATVDASTGEVTGVAIGETTITATWAAVENKYNAGSTSYTVNVIEAPQGTVYEKVTNVNQLVAGNEYILVASLKSVAMGEQGGNTYRAAVEVSIEDDKINVTDNEVTVLTLGGSEGAWTFKASDNNQYLTWSSSNSLISSEDPSAWVVTKDFMLSFASTPERILQYNSGSPRFACYTGTQTNAYLYVKEGSAVDNKEVAAVSIDKTQLELGGNNAIATITTDPATLVVSYESSDVTIAEVSSTGVVTAKAEGTVTITATWEEQTINEVIYKAGNETFSIKVVDPINGKGSLANPYTVAEVLDYNGTITGVWVKGYIVGSYINNELSDVTGDDAVESNIALYSSKEGAETENTIPVQLPNNSTIRSSLNLNGNAGMLGEEVLVYGNIETYFGDNGLKGTSDGYIILPEIGSTGYSTTYYTADLKVQEGTEAFAVTGNGNQLTYTSVGDVIPAGVAVVLKGSGPQKFQIVSAPTMTTDFTLYENNNLKGLDVAGVTVGPDNGSYVYYKLAVGTSAEDEGVVGFYWAVANGAAFNSKAHKAYLVLPASGQVVSSYAFDETVGISSPMLNEIKTEGVYTLSGVRVMSDRLPKGIYIVNGKKMVIK